MLEHITEEGQELLLSFIAHTKAQDIEGLPRDELFSLFKMSNFPAALRRPYFNRLITECLNNNILINYTTFDGAELRIHPDFLDEALPLYMKDHTRTIDEIPASDRFVSIDHNSQDFQNALEALEKLEERIKTSNEFSANPEERIVISREISVLRETLKQPLIRLSSAWVATKNSGILPWLAQHGSDAILNALATEAIGHILKIFGWI